MPDFSSLSSQLSAAPPLAMLLVFVAGVFTSLNPCIYPMIPITLAVIGSGSSGSNPPSRVRVLLLSLTYALGLASVYATLGLLAGLSGTLFGSISANPWAYFVTANVLILAALAMLDIIPIRLPARLAQRAATAGTGERFTGVFVMGAASGLVAAPCGAPVFAAVLTWVSTTGSGVLGFIYLFLFSLGMCALLVVLGMFSGLLSRIPRAGHWMIWVRRTFALIMIGAAEYYLVKMGQVFF